MGLNVNFEDTQYESREPFPAVTSPATRRPSLFLASRLAGLIRKFTDRLQAKVNTRNSARKINPFATVYQRGSRLRALSDLENIPVPRRRLTIKEDTPAAADHPLHAKWLNDIVSEFDQQVSGQTQSLSGVAADDRLFLSHAQSEVLEAYTRSLSRPQVAHAFDVSCALIDRLDCYANSKKRTPATAESKRLDDPLFISKLIHLLRRLRYMLFTILVFKSLQRLDEAVSHWQNYWHQLHKLGDDWFSEWPDGQRPLSTTWPWNIRPSLVVLWGVCWMFFAQFNNSDNNINENQDPQVPVHNFFGNTAFWEIFPQSSGESQNEEDQFQSVYGNDQTYLRQSDPDLTISQFGSGMGVPRPGSMGSMARATQPQPYQPRVSGNQYQNVTEYHDPVDLASFSNPQAPNVYNERTQTVSSSVATATSVNPQVLWPEYPADVSTNPNEIQQALGTWPGFANSSETALPYPPSEIIPTVRVDPEFAYQPYPYPPTTPEQLSVATSSVDYGSTRMATGPEPTSVGIVESGRRESATSVQTHHESSSNGRSPGSLDQPRSNRITVRRDQQPPMSGDKFTCDHEECLGKGTPPLFSRKSDWNKHMDKHERPYRCPYPGCEKIKGFTYSGGLARHYREVHDQNTMGKPRLFCDIPECPRSSGKPFTRMENLNEHKRRRHPNTGFGAASTAPASANVSPAESNLQYTSDQPEDSPRSLESPLSKKRKRETDSPTASSMGFMRFKTERTETPDDPSLSSTSHDALQQHPHPQQQFPQVSPRSIVVEYGSPVSAELATLRADIRARDQRIMEQTQEIVQKDAMIAYRDQELMRSVNMINQLQTQLAAHTQLSQSQRQQQQQQQQQPHPSAYHPQYHPTMSPAGQISYNLSPPPVTTAPPRR